MIPSYVLAATLLFAAPVEPDPSAAQSLTPKEIAEGWIQLFDGQTVMGWSAPDGSTWKVKKGALAPDGEKKATLMTTAAFQEFELYLEYRVERGGKAAVSWSCRPKAPEGERDSHDLDFEPGEWMRLSLTISKDRVGGTMSALSPKGPRMGTGFGVVGSSDVRTGWIALSGTSGSFRNIRLRPLNTKAIFNGRDLEGWKEFPGKKSKFSVTKEGWLNVKDGPGDLQTVGQYDNFVLQLECLSNGKHLNSGIFFRCRPGDYQQGYEAQIRNEFTDRPTQEYTIEEYDPQTNELKEKRRLMSPAIDYGTGAIYRRMPARRELSKDGEWFTMTIVANGRHISTWVNGVQQVDWTDNRPLKDNARNGCRLEKGAISIQGHDPTTDLSFRNFHLTDLGGK
jgi:hypothetical protein